MYGSTAGGQNPGGATKTAVFLFGDSLSVDLYERGFVKTFDCHRNDFQVLGCAASVMLII